MLADLSTSAAECFRWARLGFGNDFAVNVRPILPVVVLVVCWTIERRTIDPRLVPDRLRHGTLNVLISIVNLLLWIIPSALILRAVDDLIRRRFDGLIPVAVDLLGLTSPVQPALVWVGAFLLLDLFTYYWHRLNHRLPFFWRFHAVHHNDEAMDSTSAARFHLIEHAISFIARSLYLALLGLDAAHAYAYELIFLPCVVFHHGYFPIPESIDRYVRAFVVTPPMHRIHHSPERRFVDSNFGAVLTIWDRLFGTYQTRPEPYTHRVGLPTNDDGSERSTTIEPSPATRTTSIGRDFVSFWITPFRRIR